MNCWAKIIILTLLGLFGSSLARDRKQAQGKRFPPRHGPQSQSVDPHLSRMSIDRARAAGCLDGVLAAAELETTARTVSSCFAGGFVKEYLVHPRCGGDCTPSASTAVAKVVYACNDEPSQVKCMNKGL
jgi:hypothetical protein